MYKNSKFKVGDKVETPFGVGIFDSYVDGGFMSGSLRVRYEKVRTGGVYFWNEDDIKPYKTPHQRLLDLGFEKVAKHKYIKRDKGDIGYIIIAFAFNSYHVKCVGKNWAEFNLELAEVLVDYLEELENE